MSCYAPLYCDEPVKCHFSLSQTPPGMTPTEGLQNVQMTVTETVAYPTKEIRRVSGDRMSMQSHQTDSVMDSIYRTQNSGEGGPGGGPKGRAKSLARPKAGSIFPIEIWPPSTGWPGWPDHPMTKLKICVQDPAGNICCTKLNVFCRIPDCCQASIAMTFDDANTADTVARSNSITVYALNGCGPYAWTVIGTGFSFATSVTAGPSNVLSASASACGTGAVTIQDNCGTVVTAKIRCTTGVWCTDATKNNVCTLSGSGTLESSGDNIFNYELVVGKFKQLQSISGGGCSGTPPGSICSDICFYGPPTTCGAWCVARTTLSVGQCITPYSMVDAGCVDNPSWCCRYSLSAAYQEWKCAC